MFKKKMLSFWPGVYLLSIGPCACQCFQLLFTGAQCQSDLMIRNLYFYSVDEKKTGIKLYDMCTLLQIGNLSGKLGNRRCSALSSRTEATSSGVHLGPSNVKKCCSLLCLSHSDFQAHPSQLQNSCWSQHFYQNQTSFDERQFAGGQRQKAGAPYHFPWPPVSQPSSACLKESTLGIVSEIMSFE